MLKKLIKILLFSFTILVALVLLLIFLTGIGCLNGLIAAKIPGLAAKSINGELSIGSISGKLFSHFIIHDISVKTGTDTILKCRNIELEYEPRQLLHKKLNITLLHIDSPVFNLRQESDSSWNFMKIIKNNNEENDTAKKASAWKINLDKFSLDNMSAGIAALDTGSIPAFIHLDIHLEGSFDSDTITAKIESMRIRTQKPDFEIVDFNGEVNKKGNEIQWKNVSVALKNTIGKTDGRYNMDDESADAKLDFSPLAFEDFASLMKGTKLYGHPHLSANVSGNPAEYIFNLNITEKDQVIDLSGKIKDIRNDPSYFSGLVVSRLDGSYWTHVKNLKSDISGKLEISGHGFNMEENDVALKGRFGEAVYGGYSLKGLLFDAEKKKDKVTGSVSTGTFVGNARIKFDLSDIFGNPAYYLNATYSNVDIGKLPGADSLSSDLNGSLVVKGRGVTPGKINAGISMKSFNSEINNQKINDFGLEAVYDRGRYDFSIPGIETPFFRIKAEGQGSLKGQNNIDFTFEPSDLYSLLRPFGMPEASVSGKISGNITGTTDSLKAKLKIDLADLTYDSIKVQDIKADIDASVSGKLYSGTVQLNSDSIKYGKYSLQSADINAELAGNIVKANLELNVNDSLSAAFTGTVEGFENPLVRMNTLAINFMGNEWKSTGNSATIKLNKDDVEINGFGMSSGDQQLKVNGKLAFRGDEDLAMDIDSLQLQSMPLNNFLPYAVSGTVSAHMSLKGTSFAPVIDSRFSGDSFSLNKYKIDSLHILMNYDRELLSASGKIGFGQEEPLIINVRIPVRLSLSDSTTLLKDRAGLFASVRLGNLDLSELSSLFPLKNISFSGSLNAEAEVNNTINDPVIKGSLDVRNGTFRDREFGIDYRDIRLSAAMDSDRLKIGEFVARSGKGNLGLSGSINLNSKDSLNTKDVTMNLKTSDFQALKSGTAELNFNSDIGITGSFAKPKMKGNVTVNSSKVNIDYFTSKFSRIKDEPDLPLLDQALGDTIDLDIPSDSTSGIISGTSLFKNLSGELTLDIPGNTWVTGKDMNFELDGTLRAVKSSPDISLFGDLNVRRGYYKIYGRKFEFSRGVITFTGGSEFNPDLDVDIVYRFRDIEKNMRDLTLNIKGKLMQPQYAFMLDNEAIEEKDAISYIAFGKSINQLGEGEKEKMSGQDIALGVAVTQLSSVLKGILQEEAGIDVFEFTGGEDWRSGSVTIGKYITNRLFLSYDRSFDFDKQRKTSVSEKIMLEYQLLRNLLIKATNQDVNSGFDLIFKKTWK